MSALVIDARRISDGKAVFIKKIASGYPEEKLASHLSSTELRSDPRNHCVPILDLIPAPNGEPMTYVVMPLLRYIDKPPFETVDEVLECGEQLLEVRNTRPSCPFWTDL